MTLKTGSEYIESIRQMKFNFYLLGYFGLMMVLKQYFNTQTTPALGLPEWIFGMAIPAGSALIILRILQTLIRELRGEK